MPTGRPAAKCNVRFAALNRADPPYLEHEAPWQAGYPIAIRGVTERALVKVEQWPSAARLVDQLVEIAQSRLRKASATPNSR